MARLKNSVLFLVFFFLIGCQGKGTETGNPAFSYSNAPENVSSGYPSGWSYTEHSVPAFDTAGPGFGSPAPASAPGIDTSRSANTVFTDGTSTVTVYYVTLSSQPTSLLNYLQTLFPTRNFEVYSGMNLSGFFYDNPQFGVTGGDLQEYYFLQGTKLLYVVTDIVADLFSVNNKVQQSRVIINNLRFN